MTNIDTTTSASPRAASQTDIVTQLQGIVRQLSNSNNISIPDLIAAINALSLVPKSYTVATLPASPAFGQIATVTDGTSGLTWGQTVTGGHSTRYLVWWNTSNWTVVGT